MAWAGIFLLSIVVVALAVRWFVNASPARLARGVRVGAIWLVAAAVLALAFTGRLPMVLAVIGPLGALILAFAKLRNQRRGPAQGWDDASGRKSNVTTDRLDMTFDHDSGELDGRVTAGVFAGRMLSDMSLDELRALLQEAVAAQDTHSTNVLTSYLDRTYGEDWHDGAGAGQDTGARQNDGAMTRDEAWRVLGLSAGATEEDIRSAHRRLMKQAHPDHGGSDYLAAKINQAKDVLLGG